MLLFLLPFAGAVLAFPVAVHARDAEAVEKVFNAKTFTLANGLTGVVFENRSVPVVTHMVWYRVGAADETPGKSGIAHFLEHLMFKGQSYPGLGEFAPGEFSKKVKSLGGNDNAFTSQDYTAYFQSISSDQLETVMTMEAGRMRGLALPREEVESERKVILEERRQRTDNDPRAQFEEQLDEALFPNHPYGTPVIGWFHEMEGLSWEDATGFYNRWYAPNNALLVVSGDTSVEEVEALAKKTYGKIQKSDVPVRARTASPPFIANTSVRMAHEVVKEPVFMRTYRVPSARQDGKTCLALQVLEEIMDGGPTSRLYKALVVDQKIASSVSLSYSAYAWDDATLSVAGTAMEGYTAEQVEEAIDKQIATLIKDGVSDQELKDAVMRMQAEAIYARDSVTGPAMIIGTSLSTGASLEDLENWPVLIAEVSAEEVRNVAAQYLSPEAPTKTPFVNGYLYPANGDSGEKKQ